MCSISILKKIVFVILSFCVCIPQFIFAFNSDVTVSAIVNQNNSGASGSRIATGSVNLVTIVNFSGSAYPFSRVYILKDGEIVANTIADQSASFSVSLLGLSTDTYNFSIYSEDGNNRKSSTFSFSIYITEGTTVSIGNIFLSPTIDINKSQVKRGDSIVIFGQSIPRKEVLISIKSNEEYFFRVFSNEMGAYLYNLDTSILNIGKIQAKSKNTIDTQSSSYSTIVSFFVGDNSKVNNKTDCSILRGDLNCDNRVDLVDFSIMAFWYKKINPPQKIDLNNDGKINLVDFSIMAFHWTG